MFKKNLKLYLSILFVSLIAVSALYYVEQYGSIFVRIVEIGGVWGMLTYVLITIAAVVLAPISTLPLVPLAGIIWGGFLAGILSVVGWSAGALIAFWLARQFGRPLVKHIASIKKICEIESRLPRQNRFWTIVFLRIALPVDVLSYALGLFSDMSYGNYFLATVVGVSPFAFILTYAGMLPFIYQISALVLSLIILATGLQIVYRKK